MDSLGEDKATSKVAPSWYAIQRLLPMAGSTWKNLPLALVLLLALASTEVILPQLIKLAIDGPLSPSSLDSSAAKLDQIQFLTQQFIAFLALGFVANYLSTLMLQRFGQTLVWNLRTNVAAKLHRLPISYFDKNATGRTVSRAINDSNAISELFTSVLAASIGDLLMIAGILVVLLLTDPILSFILLFFCPALVGVAAWFRARSAPLYTVQRRLLAIINSFFAELFEGLATVKSFGGQAFLRQRFSTLNEECLSNEIDLVRKVAIFRPAFSIAQIIATGLLLTIGGLNVLKGQASLGTLVSSLLYIRLLFAPLQELAERYNIMLRATIASHRVLSILDEKEEPTGKLLPGQQQTLSFENVSYFYSADKPVLNHISFQVKPGETIALVGPTGSGKSTIISLILGFYQLNPEVGHQGRITYGDQPISNLNLAAWRQRLAFVSQDLFLFKASVLDNVSLFAELPRDRILNALEQVGASRFIEELPQGVDTIVGETGYQLSTGQRQLLSFARALAFEPELLILDEATASIDSKTEAQLDKLLSELLQGRQSIIIAHRLATIRRADRILVLHNGRIIEEGTHKELVKADGLYAAMLSKLDNKSKD